MSDTIHALASGAARAGVAVVRVSGPDAGEAIRRITRAPVPEPRYAALRGFWSDTEGSLPFDRGLVLWFPAPNSFTGEDVAEFHLHGGPAVVAALTRALSALAGTRPAEPGEFSRRAFANGKLDLTAAEGIADLVEAETEAQMIQARRQMEGELGALYDGWRESLIAVLARWEAAIDFPDEDLPEDMDMAARELLSDLHSAISAHLDDGHRGERLRDGIRLAILGAPNAGKSSLLNRLARRDAAIVSPLAGTTRDVIEIHLDVAGFPLLVADTAGLRDSADMIESEGVSRARQQAEQADIRLVLFDAGLYPALDADSRNLIDETTLVILNKNDLADQALPHTIAGRPALALSARTGDGMNILLDHLGGLLADHWAPGRQPGLTRARHRDALERARDALARAMDAPLAELAAEDLRLAGQALGRITGKVETEEVLDRIFREFCIGK